MANWRPDSTFLRKLVVAMSMLWPLIAVGQSPSNPQALQKSAIEKVDRWIDYVRRTGDAKNTLSDLLSAQADLNTSVNLFLDTNNYAGAALSLYELATIERLQDRFQPSVTLYERAIEFAKRANRTDYQTRALANLSYSETQIGELDSAEEHAREAVSLGPGCGNKDYYFDALTSAAEVEEKRGNTVAAGDYLNRALAMVDQLGDRKSIYLAYMDRADLYYSMASKCTRTNQSNFSACGESARLAEADYQKAIRLAQDLGYSFMAQIAQDQLNNLGVISALIQSRQKTLETVMKSPLFNPQKPSDVAVNELFATGRWDASTVAALEEAIRSVRAYQADAQQKGLVVPLLNAIDFCVEGQIAAARGDNDAALAAFTKAHALFEKDRRKLTEEKARSSVLEDQVGCYLQPALILLQEKRDEEAFTIFEGVRSRTIADLVASRPLTLETGAAQELFSERHSLSSRIGARQEKLFNLTSSGVNDESLKQVAELQASIDALQQQLDAVDSRIAKDAPKLRELTAAEPVSLASVQQSAARGGYDVLYYVVMDGAVNLWHIGASDVEVRNVALPHAILSVKLKTLRDSLEARRDDPNAHFNEDISRQLFLFLIQPMLGYVKTQHLVVIPDAELNSVPFQAFQNPATGQYLGETFSVSYAPSGTILDQLETRSNLRNGTLLAVADSSMFEAGQEVKAIGEIYGGRGKVVAQNATKANLKAWASKYDIVHLSVHGKFNGTDPLLSYLQLREDPPDDGRLTAAEMFGLPLRRNALVVLSACETGRAETTDSNEIVGMVRPLLYAGAGGLVLSDWEVDAASTRLWMETFYRAGQTNPAPEAARLALVAVKSHPEYGHPYFWAPFVMTGK